MKMESLLEEDNLDMGIPIGTPDRSLRKYKVGDYIGGYQVIQICKANATRQVCICQTSADDAKYVVKMDCAINGNIKMELSRMRAVPYHPNVVHIFDAFILNDMPHIVMPYFEGVNENGKPYGSSLADLINNDWSFTFKDVLWIAISVCNGMAYCQKHIENFVHGDIKPENILFEPLEEAKINIGLCKYKVMVSDFGFGKTPGYCNSALDEPTNKVDDIYAFAVTMGEICEKVKVSGRIEDKWGMTAFLGGLREILNNKCVRNEISFSDLYNGYAEALEVIMGLNTLGYCAEDVLPDLQLSINEQIVTEINQCTTMMHIEHDYEGVEKKLLRLLHDPKVEGKLLDELTVTQFVRFQLLNVYFITEKWQEFDRELYEMKRYLQQSHHPVKYRGVIRYSKDIAMDTAIIEQLAMLQRGGECKITLLIQAIRLDVDCSEWLETMLSYIDKKCPEKIEEVQKRFDELTLPHGATKKELFSYHYMLGTYFIHLEDYSQACPHYQYLVQEDIDQMENTFRYAICLYNTGNIIYSMMYFAHAYDIMQKDEWFQQPYDWDDMIVILLCLYYLCDYNYLFQVYEKSLQTLSSPGAEVAEWLNHIIKLSADNQKSLAAWREKEQDIYHTSSGIAAVRYLQIRAKQVLCENESKIYDAMNRIPMQIFLESSRAMARVFVETEDYEEGIKECNLMLQFDHTYFDAFMLRGYCFLCQYRKDKTLLDKKAAAQRDLKQAERYLYAMYPSFEGKENPRAGETKIVLGKLLKEVEN